MTQNRRIGPTGPNRRTRRTPFIGAILLAVGVRAEPDAGSVGWPALNGPSGNLQPSPSDVRWGDDPGEARVAWLSDERDFGSAKTGRQTFRRQLEFPVAFGKFRTTHFAAWPDGGGTFSAAVRGGNCCVAVGFGEDSCFVAMTAPGLKPETKSEVRSVDAGGRTWIVLTLQPGDPPALEPTTDGLRIGTRTLTCDGHQIEER